MCVRKMFMIIYDGKFFLVELNLKLIVFFFKLRLFVKNFFILCLFNFLFEILLILFYFCLEIKFNEMIFLFILFY